MFKILWVQCVLTMALDHLDGFVLSNDSNDLDISDQIACDVLVKNS